MEKLSEEARQEIASSLEPASRLSEKYGVSVEDIESLRTFSDDFDDFEESQNEDATPPPEPADIFQALSLKLRLLLESQEKEVALALDEMTGMILEKANHVRRKIEMCEEIIAESKTA